MIYRVIRSRWLYPLLAVLMIVVFAVSAPLKPAQPVQPAQPASEPTLVQDPLQLWPEELNRTAMEQVVQRQPLVVLLLVVLLGIMLTLAVTGVIFTASDLVSGRGRKRWREPSRPLPPWSFSEAWRTFALILFVAGMLPFAAVLWGAKAGTADFGALIVMTGLDLFVVVVVLTFAQGHGTPARVVFLGRGRSVGAALRAGFRDYITAFPWLFLLLSLIAKIVKELGLHIPPEEMQRLLFRDQEPRVLVLVFVLACVIAPVAEELFFRGVLFGALRRSTSRWAAIAVSAGAFALVHTNPVGFLPIMALGCLLSDLYDRSGMLIVPIMVHVAHNTLLMGMALTFRQMLLP